MYRSTQSQKNIPAGGSNKFGLPDVCVIGVKTGSASSCEVWEYFGGKQDLNTPQEDADAWFKVDTVAANASLVKLHDPAPSGLQIRAVVGTCHVYIV